MKTAFLTILALAVIEVACDGQVRGVVAGSRADANLRAQQARQVGELAIEVENAKEIGKSLFGVDERWGIKSRDFAESTMDNKRPIEFRVGDWGFTHYFFRSEKKISKSEFLAFPTDKGSDVVLIRGLDTSKLNAGMEFIIQHPLVVTTTFSYETVGGLKNTVLVLERDDITLANKIAEGHGTAEKRLFRNWTDTAGKFSGNAKFLKLVSNRLYLKKEDGTEVNFPVTRLSKDDKTFLLEELIHRSQADRFQDEVIDAKNKADEVMDANELTTAEREYVAAYVNNSGKRPSKKPGKSEMAKVNEVISTDEVKEWVRVEIQYQKELISQRQ